MPFDVVKKAVEDALGKPITEAFAEFQEKPLGAASIAQAHLAKLPDGQQVVVKVQRPGIGATMGEDIALLRKGAGVMRLTGLDQTVDLNMVLDEMWATAQEEMDFRQEARNLAEFAEKNGNIRCIACPKVYPELCCQTLLTMEYIAGYSLLDQQTLVQEGYDLKDIGDKLADNYVKQIVQDGFFHADPHPGNIRIREADRLAGHGHDGPHYRAGSKAHAGGHHGGILPRRGESAADRHGHGPHYGPGRQYAADQRH